MEPMAVIEKVSPVWAVECDNPKCFRTFVPDDYWDKRTEGRARAAAARAGWQVRPFLGPGSRSKPDLCPGHREGN